MKSDRHRRVGTPLAILGLVLMAACGGARTTPDVAQAPPNVLPDRPITPRDADETERLLALLEPCRVRALASYPRAKARFVAGLPANHHFAVTTRLVDADARSEQVFVLVDSISGSVVFGKLASDIHVVRGYQHGQSLRVDERDILDWTIIRPDGSEEGNLMGQVVDAIQDGKADPGAVCRGAARSQ